jgi:hypothetical protein
MQTKDQSEIVKLNTHIRMSDRIDVLMEQSLQLMDIVKKNQEEVNRLKEKQDKLKVGV